ncbi:MAG: T9SS type A sorting domain-containing protein [Bacteroidetes bacterium]|nr:T9SS type A sorting domain-containing protein [Bacteroidota bacterium]
MKTTITKKLLGLALSVFSMAAMAQCPTSVSISIVSNTDDGNLTVQPVFGGSTPTSMTNSFQLMSLSNSYSYYSYNTGAVTFSNVSNGTYTLCLNADSLNYPNCPGVHACMLVTVTNTTTPACNPAFTYYTDSSCVTHFVNNSTGATSYQWYINGVFYASPNPSISLANGSYHAVLFNYINGNMCDSIGQTVNVGCGGGSCHASFTYYTDSNCVTHFINTSTGATNYQWNIDNIVYTSVNPSISLSNGTHYATIYNYINNSFCDSLSQLAVVACGSNTASPCQVNSDFHIFADSTNAGNFFAYNLSTGTSTLSYSWDFGDGTPPSTQQYPFHQYATPGSYIICLTVSATTGSVTCSDTHCDSSSTHRMSSGFMMSQLHVIPQNMTTGIKQQDAVTGLKAFPNPIADELTIEATTVENIKTNYVLTDALGRMVLTGSLEHSKATLNTSSLPQGFYSLSITNEKGATLKTIKLVK